MAKKLKITLKKGLPGRLGRHRRTVYSLGLTKTYQTVEHADCPTLRGKLDQVGYLLQIEEVSA